MKHKKLLIVISVAVISYVCNDLLTDKFETEVIRIETGRLKGTKGISRDGREYFQFLGIPYAKPPVGELRFESPQPVSKWEDVLDARRYGSKCSQLDLIFSAPDGNEDCLFLNVYVPKLPEGKAKLLPVMVFFHGGIYFFGSSTGYRADFFMDEDVVLVTVNYRLASFGFLNTGDGVVRGNMGLKDQSMSLKWVQQNIRQFGGDPKLVTIFGQSAGGASAHLHMVSPLSKAAIDCATIEYSWALQVKSILDDVGMSFVWDAQSAQALSLNFEEIMRRIHDQSIQNDLSRAQASSYHPLYVTINDTFQTSKYLQLMLPSQFVRTYAQLRLNSDYISFGLFHRVISQSGTALSPWTIWKDPAAQAKRFGARLGCPTDTTKTMVACMKKISMHDIMIAHQEVLVPFRDMITVFVPTVESGAVNGDTFLPELPRDLLKAGKYEKVPWIAGATAQDGLLFSSAIIRNDTVRDIVYQDFSSVMSQVIFSKPDPQVAVKLKEHFMPTLPTLSDRMSFLRLTNMFTDRSFFNGVHEAAVLQSSLSPVFLYQYSYKGEFRACNLLINVKRKYPVILEFSAYVIKNLITKYILRKDLPYYGAGHIDDVALLFHMPWITNVKIGHPDYEMSKALVKAWASFAQDKKTIKLISEPWKPVNAKDSTLQYMNISLNPAVIDDPMAERYAFWQSLNLTDA